MKSFNVRLSAKDAEAVRMLQADGVNVSELCRVALQNEADWHRRRRGGIKSVRKYFDELFRRFPESEGSRHGEDQTFQDHVNADHERIVRSYLGRRQPARRAG
jgi:hypothetical protein